MRKLIYKFSGVESIKQSFNPIYYISILFFKIFIKLNGNKIQRGLFKDLYLNNSKRGSEYMPKYLGTYELELYTVISDYINYTGEKLIIDVGADDGYYTIGLAKCINEGTVLSFELDIDSFSVLKDNIKLNSALLKHNVDILLHNKKVEQFEDLYSLIKPYKERVILIKTDIEGGEYELFTNSFIESLKEYKVVLVIETHFDPIAESNLVNKFNLNDFDVKLIDKYSRSKGAYDFPLNFLSKSLLTIFWSRWTNEHRPKYNRWLIAKNKL